MTSAMRILSYRVATDAVNDYVRIGESTTIESLQYFCNSIIEIFGPKYLRSPTTTDIARLLAIGETISSPQGVKKQQFATTQESIRKDVKRAFGVLQSRFAIVGGAVHFWDPKMLGNIMKSCIILHNIIVEDGRDEHLDFSYEISSTNAPVLLSCSSNNDFQSFMSRHLGIRDKNAYHALRNDLIEHMWYLHGEN
ncbi:uncharacterized protein LOC114291684 [Camellia sinensis]|uniref:uncharacterized protein LOC114291684 n=1 Tax=Camellia sinensis TaxID=4442 RepID=UPI0010355C90|nr:uncharacterized protein LOC114291684 [Camellia sinensis]